jgi:hypothetical protein
MLIKGVIDKSNPMSLEKQMLEAWDTAVDAAFMSCDEERLRQLLDIAEIGGQDDNACP